MYLLRKVLILLGFTGILWQPFSTTAQTLTLSGATGTPGSTVLMNLSMSGSGGGFSALQWNLQYASSSIASVTAQASSALTAAGKKISCAPTAGSYLCLAYGMNGTPVPDGTVAVVSVTLPSTAATTAISVNKTLAVSGSGSALTLSGSGAVLTVQQAGPASVNLLACDSTYLPLGGSTNCTLQLSAAVTKSTSIPLTTSSPLLVIPASVTVPAGASSVKFNAVSTATAPVTATLSAVLDGTINTSLTLSNLTVKTLSCVPSTLVSGDSGTCTISLTGTTPTSLLISLAAGNSVLIPQSVTVPAGASSAAFPVTCTATAKGTVVLSATLAGHSVTTSLSVDVTSTFRLLINSGGPSYADGAGRTWTADTGFSGGSPLNVPISVRNTTVAALYQTARVGVSTYTIKPPKNGAYVVNLKFAEIATYGSGNRLFNVAINGVPVLTNFDVFAEGEGPYVAVDRSFPVNVTGGTISIQFLNGTRGQPMVNGIEVVSAGQALSALPAVRINAGGNTYETPYSYDPNGASGILTEFWTPDRDFSGGSVCAGTPTILNTSAQALYQTCRLGTFTYSTAVPNGDYSVTLKFAEPVRTGARQRLFDVTINGVKVLDEFDIFAQAGARTALDKVFPVKVTGGQITIQFTNGAADLPMVNAIQIVESGQGF